MFRIRLAICSLSLKNLTLWMQCQSHGAAKLSSERVIFLLLDNTLDTMCHLHFKGLLRTFVRRIIFPSSWSNKMKITKPARGTEHAGIWGLFSPLYHLCCSEMNLIWEQSARLLEILHLLLHMRLLRCSVWLLGCLREHHCLYVPGIRRTVSGLFEVFMNQDGLFTFSQAIGPTSRFPVLLRRLADVRRLPMSSCLSLCLPLSPDESRALPARARNSKRLDVHTVTVHHSSGSLFTWHYLLCVIKCPSKCSSHLKFSQLDVREWGMFW